MTGFLPSVTPAQDIAGFVEICKESDSNLPATGLFTFKVGGLKETFIAPVAACTGPISVPGGLVTVEEVEKAGTVLTEVTTLPPDRVADFNLSLRTATVRVLAGDVSTQTVLILRSKSSKLDSVPSAAVSSRSRPVPLSGAANRRQLTRLTFSDLVAILPGRQGLNQCGANLLQLRIGGAVTAE